MELNRKTLGIKLFEIVLQKFSGVRTFGTKYSRMDQVNFFKGCLPQILLGSILDTLSHLILKTSFTSIRLRQC